METRSFKELENEINELYNQYKEKDLRKLVSKKNGDIIVSSPHISSIKYCEGTIWEHEIDILIPGKKTFEVGYRNLSEKIQRNDIKIVVTEDSTGGEALSYQKIIEDLYNKVNGDYDNYIWYKNLLSIIYSENNLNEVEGIEEIYIEVDGYKLPTLVSFFRWCGTQENINYPRAWGKDLCFARYFEAIYAGYIQNKTLLRTIRKRLNGRVPLYRDVEIHGNVVDLYNNCLNHRKHSLINIHE